MDEKMKETLDKMAEMQVDLESLLIDTQNLIDACDEETE